VAYCVHCGEELRPSAAFCGNCGEPTGQPSPSQRASYGGFWRRAVGLLVDALVLGVPIGIALAVAIVHGYRFGYHYHPHAHGNQPILTSPSPQRQGVLQLVGAIPSWLYTAGFMSSGWQATPGQRLLGLRTQRTDGGRVSFGRASGRYFASIVSGYLLLTGYFMMLFTERRQTLHDRLAGTVVVRR
jgi:uncharacterized RDD family membrane protein YckC